MVTSNFVKEKEAASCSKASVALMFVLCFILVFCSVSYYSPLNFNAKDLNSAQFRQIIDKENGFNRRTFVLTNHMP